MKKIFTFILLFCCTLAASAQSEDNDSYRFVDKSGKELAPGASINVTEGEYDDIDDSYLMKIPVSIINKSGEQDLSIRLKCEIVKIDNGEFQTCWPENCKAPWGEIGSHYGSVANAYPKNTSKDIQSEWICDNTKTGTATVKLTIEQGDGDDNSFDCYYAGPELTVNFYKGVDPTGIKNVSNTDNVKSTVFFTLDGRQTTSEAKGVKIVRLSNGTVKKTIKQ